VIDKLYLLSVESSIWCGDSEIKIKKSQGGLKGGRKAKRHETNCEFLERVKEKIDLMRWG
jgi:hypothetical protein